MMKQELLQERLTLIHPVQSDGTKVKHYYNTAGTIVKSQ